MANSIGPAEQTAKLQVALSILEGLDRTRNLHRGVAILLFVVSAGLGVRAFFYLSDLTLWGEVSEYVALFITAVSWVSIIPIWILAYLIFMILLNAIGFADLRSTARNRLSELMLNRDELDDLRDALVSREWRHADILDTAIADLANAKPIH